MFINNTIIQKTIDWLGDDGINFFQRVKKEHGTVSPVYNEGKFPHPVHFIEGMTVRNFLTSSMGYSWADVEEGWIDLIEEVLKELEDENSDV